MSELLQHLKQHLGERPQPLRLLVALSGGLDSVCLLHGVQQLRRRGELDCSLRAIHVNHGLQPEAGAWQGFCETFCAGLGVPLVTSRLNLDPKKLQGNLEEKARHARYAEFERKLGAGEILLLAHHLDDQLETFLLRLMRGAGLQGLSGMPQGRKLGHNSLLRPLLQLGREQLREYANSAGLRWNDDPSNEDTSLDRNFCRHELLPLVESRWPEYRDSTAKSLSLLDEAVTLVNELAASDLATVATAQGGVIELSPLMALTRARQRNLLRFWLKHLGLEVPGWHRLHQLVAEVLPAAADSNPELAEAGYRLCRFNNRLYALLEKPHLPPEQTAGWNPLTEKMLPLAGNGVLQAVSSSEHALDANIGELQVRYRDGGESLQMPGRPNKALKEILREAGVEPWLRDRVPLLYRGEQLVCVPGIGVAVTHAALPDTAGLQILWQQPKLLAG